MRSLSPACRLRRSAPTTTGPGGRRGRRSPSPTSTARPRRRAGGSSPGTCWPGLRCVLHPPRPSALRLHPRPRPHQQVRSVRTFRCLHRQPSFSPLQLGVLGPPASTSCLHRRRMRLSRTRTSQRRRRESSLTSRRRQRMPGGGREKRKWS